MPRKSTPAAPTDAATPQWTPQELLAVKHLGPGVIGQAKYDAVQQYIASTNGGKFGPALLGDPAYNQAGPVKIVNGVPVFADQLEPRP